MSEAAKQSYPHATCELGRLYLAQKELDKAALWFRQGAQEDCLAAEIILAQLLLGATGATSEQQEEGIDLLRKAAKHNSVQALFLLGKAYEQQKKMEEAVNCYREAADKGLMDAQMKLGFLLSEGFSTKLDRIEAWVRFRQAASQGNGFAAKRANWIERLLTEEQLEDAKRWLKQIEKGHGWLDMVPSRKP
jgi:TPR repeat protein